MTTREDLYDLVWAQPMTRLATQFDVSSSYLARVCTVLNVPRPDRGYWSKLAVGKAPPKEALPPAQPGDQLVWRKGETLPPPARPRAVPRPRSRRSDAKVIVPRAQTHPLIRGAAGHFLNTRTVERDAYLKPFKKLLVDVISSASCLNRALDIANDLFNGLESLGHHVVIAPADQRWSRKRVDERETKTKDRSPYYTNSLWSPYRPTVVFIDDLAIGLTIVEMSEEVLMRYAGGKYVRESDYLKSAAARYPSHHTWTTTHTLPSGRLRLVAFSPYGSVDWSIVWQEAGTSSLKTSIAKIVGEIEKATAGLRAQLAEAERQAEIRRQEWAIAEERRRRVEDQRRIEESVRQSRDDLRTVIERWSAVMSVEQFFAGVELRAEVLPKDERDAVEERLRLAREFLGSQDPLTFFLDWKTPGERYRPLYQADSGPDTRS